MSRMLIVYRLPIDVFLNQSIKSIILFAITPALSVELPKMILLSRFLFIMATKSSLSVQASHQISVKRFLKAGDNSFFPKSPLGFMVPIKRKLSCAVINSEFSELLMSVPFSAISKVRSGSVATYLKLVHIVDKAYFFTDLKVSLIFLRHCHQLKIFHLQETRFHFSLHLLRDRPPIQTVY